MRWSGLCLAATLLASNVARADQEPFPADVVTTTPLERKPVGGLRRTGAILAAIGPGLFLRGIGSYVVGEKRTAKKLLKVGVVGAGGAALGGAAVGLSGGYPPTMPLLPVLLVGGGLFFTSWWADIAVAANLRHLVEGNTARARAPWSVELATQWLNDPYRSAGLFRLAGHVELGRIGLATAGAIDAENEIRDSEAEVRYRFHGAAPTGTPIADGSRLIARTGVRTHTDDGDNVSILTGEIELIGRLDMFHIDRTLRGTFVQLSTGVGLERVQYTGDSESNNVFLATFAWGFYLGNRGEASIYYDHRRDTMVGGLPAYRAAGFVGSLGANLDWMFDRHWGTRLQIDWGNAVVTTFGLRYQGAAR